MPCEPSLHFSWHTLHRTLTKMSCLLLEYEVCHVMPREHRIHLSCHIVHCVCASCSLPYMLGVLITTSFNQVWTLSCNATWIFVLFLMSHCVLCIAHCVISKTIQSNFHTYRLCCEILKYSQVYEPYESIVGQERGRTHRDLNERRKIKSNLNQINPNPV